MQGNPFPGNTDSVQRGADLYATHCLSCHGAQARGGWSEAEAVKIQTPRIVDKSVSVIAYSAAYGKGAFMPAFEDQLTKEQLWDIANYVKSLE